MQEGDPPIDLSDLIRAVEDETQASTDLERLDVAVKYGQLLRDMGEDLVGHFVDQARGGGASWAQVGERLGVTKQAAQQRHVHRTPRFFGRRFRTATPGPFERFTQDAKDVIVAAQSEARTLRHNYVGVEHLLLALSKDGEISPLLGRVGASRKAILQTIREIVGEGKEAPKGTIPFTPRSKQALESAARAAARSDERIEPKHLLLGVLDQSKGVGAEVLDALNVSRDDLRRDLNALAHDS